MGMKLKSHHLFVVMLLLAKKEEEKWHILSLFCLVARMCESLNRNFVRFAVKEFILYHTWRDIKHLLQLTSAWCAGSSAQRALTTSTVEQVSNFLIIRKLFFMPINDAFSLLLFMLLASLFVYLHIHWCTEALVRLPPTSLLTRWEVLDGNCVKIASYTNLIWLLYSPHSLECSLNQIESWWKLFFFSTRFEPSTTSPQIKCVLQLTLLGELVK